MRHRARHPAWGTVAGWVVVLLVLGCATSIGLVWVLAFTRPGPGGLLYEGFKGRVDLGGIKRGTFTLDVATFESPWCAGRYFRFIGGGDYPDPDELARRFGAAIPGVLPAHHRRWCVVHDAARGRVRDGGEAWEYRYGWPWRCVVTTYGSLDPVAHPKPWEYVGGVHFDTTVLSGWRGTNAVTLPYRALWGGLALDTLTFAAAWLVVLLAAGAGRRVWRRRHGRCTACGYDLGGALSGGCPECGWGRESGKLKVES